MGHFSTFAAVFSISANATECRNQLWPQHDSIAQQGRTRRLIVFLFGGRIVDQHAASCSFLACLAIGAEPASLVWPKKLARRKNLYFTGRSRLPEDPSWDDGKQAGFLDFTDFLDLPIAARTVPD